MIATSTVLRKAFIVVSLLLLNALVPPMVVVVAAWVVVPGGGRGQSPRRHRPQPFSPNRVWSKAPLLLRSESSGLVNYIHVAAMAQQSIADETETSEHSNTNSTGSVEAASLPAAAQQEAAELRRRADQLRTEARALELALLESTSSRRTKATAAREDWMERLFWNSRPQTAPAIARILMEDYCTEDQAMDLLEALLHRRRQTAVAGGGVLGGADAINQTEVDLVGTHIQLLIDAAAVIDGIYNNNKNSTEQVEAGRRRWSGRTEAQMRSRLKEWALSDQLQLRRSMAATVQTSVMQQRNRNRTTVFHYLRQTLGIPHLYTLYGETPSEKNSTLVNQSKPRTGSSGKRSDPLPTWVPSSLVQHVTGGSTSPLLNAEDVRSIKDRVLSKTRFYCTSSSATPSVAIFRGNMRPGKASPLAAPTKEGAFSTAVVFAEIHAALLEQEQLANAVQLFLSLDPEVPSAGESSHRLFVIAALPKQVTALDANKSRLRVAIHCMSSFLALATILGFSVNCFALNPKVFDGVVHKCNLSALSKCRNVAAGVLGLQVVHEIAHWIAAKRHGIMTGLPLLLPGIELGTFGCITPIQSFPPSRSALLDFAMSGPLASLLLSLLLMVYGCFKTIYASETSLIDFPVASVALLKSSFLSGSILAHFLPKVLMMPASQPIPLHPCFLVGFSQLYMSALNLLPIFSLDGGRACTAVFGARIGALTSIWTLLYILSLALSGSGVAWTWGVMILCFQRRPDVALRDEVTPVGDARIGMWAFGTMMSVLSLLPFPGGRGFM